MTDTIEEQESLNDFKYKTDLITHKNIHKNHGYILLKLDKNYAKIGVNTKKSETVDKRSTLYDGTIFSAANFCAMAAINEKNLFLLGANVDFLNQIDNSDDDIIFEAHSKANASGKKNIDVIGTINDITVFKGHFTAIKLDNNSLIKDKSIKSTESK